MENLGTEVGQKMRCAVKAKLIELGTGASSGGYIDDELPDYVMIMVANKRTKQQMRDDLQLFLIENTDIFVNWLHDVLEKLQEVSLPASITQKVSGKSSSAAAATDPKKDKKSKRAKRTQRDQSPPQGSITDVFADQLIGKAKRSLDVESQAPVKKSETRKEVPANDFNIPSVTDLVKNAVVSSKWKEIEELEQIQKQIDEAKRQLKIMPGEPIEAPKATSPEQEDDEEEDFLNLKADDMDDEDNDSQPKGTTGKESSTSSNSLTHRRNRSPIVFERARARHSPDNSRERESRPERASGKNGSAGRAENIISLSAHRQMERELYTPVHRRRDENVNTSSGAQAPTRRPRNPSPERDSRRHRQPEPQDHRNSSGAADRDRNSVHHRQRSPHRRDRREASPLRESRRPFRERERERATPPPTPAHQLSSRATRTEVVRTAKEHVAAVPVRQRIGSRVIVAPPKLVEEEEEVDVPVSSVVTIKPRPVVAKNRQANKNLLLRAMADAQKSMVGTLPKPLEAPVAATMRLSARAEGSGGGGIKDRLGGITNRVASKRQRSQINAIVSSLDPILKRQKPNEKIIIEIGPNDGFSESDEDEGELEVQGKQQNGNNGSTNAEEVEYVPKPVDMRSKEAETGLIVAVAEEEEDKAEAIDESDSNTQFVVTLDGAFKKTAQAAARKRMDVAQRREVLLETVKKVPVRTEVGIRSRLSARSAATEVVEERRQEVREERGPRKLVDLRQRVQEKRNESPGQRRQGGRGEPPATSPTAMNRKRRSPIKFSENRQDNGGEPQNRESEKVVIAAAPQRKRIRITDSPQNEDSATPAAANGDDPKATSVVGLSKEKRDPKKYDNIPPLLSSVAVLASGSTLGKTLERCKYYPNCARGELCEFVHPTTNCQTFPNCKFGDNCLYIHPKCKFDLACIRPDCNFSHTVSSAAPLSSHVVPVQNYKSISLNQLPAGRVGPPICRFYPNCTNSLCNFFHPKMCFYGSNCPNRLECNFYHHETPAADKFKWVSPMTG